MFYKFCQAIIKFVAKQSASIAALLASIMALFNSVYIDSQTKELRFELSWTPGAVINYVLLLFILIVYALHIYDRSKEKLERENERRKWFDDVCQQVYKTLELTEDFRVSLFEEGNGQLRIIGRFARFQDEHDTEVKFTSNMGCVGIAFHTGQMCIIDELPDFEEEPDRYFEIMKTSGLMQPDDVKMLHRKNRSYFSHPVSHFDSYATAAVLCLDSTSERAFSGDEELVGELSSYVATFLSHNFRRDITYAFQRT